MKPLGNNCISRALSVLYGSIVAGRNRRYDRIEGYKPKQRVISIGCVHAGGTGKTPLAIKLGGYFESRSRQVAFLSRGYKRRSRGPVIVGPGEKPQWQDVGDEPCMIHGQIPGSWLGIDTRRSRAARMLSARLPDDAVFILDDGFQHRQLARDIDIVCLPPNPYDDMLQPAGYLREPLSSLSRAHLLCLTGAEDQQEQLISDHRRLSAQFPDIPAVILLQQFDCWVHAATGEKSRQLPLKKPALISGIARPQRFISMVKRAGIQPVETVIFGDHHIYTAAQIEKIAKTGPDGLITTQKDICRLNALKLVNCFDIWYLNINLGFHIPEMDATFYSIINDK
jgi:tetraacyldisaccharide 4'-kinase